ncbi:hypothetical protein FO519_005619 [Halicephalobus sp. NKZ332]|nr:hypothetical protein FO519_005619 [Halicephalobus sp. NKZ332]
MRVNLSFSMSNELEPDELGTDWFTRLNAPFFTHSTGLEELDDSLGGGIKPREIISINGDGGSGKTQLVWTIMTEFLLRNRSEKGFIYYVDFHRGLVPVRLRQILRARARELDEKDVEKLLKKILYIHLNDEQELWELVRNFSNYCGEKNAMMLIIENIGSILARTTISGIQKELQRKIHYVLDYIGSTKNIPVIITNHIAQDNVKPALGVFWNELIQKHIFLGSYGGNQVMQYFFEMQPHKLLRFFVSDTGIKIVKR